MRTVTFQSVLYYVAARLGLEPERNLLPAQARAFGRFIEERVREAWESFQWPELCPTEERYYRPVYSPADTYAIDDEVYDADEEGYFRSLQDANAGNEVTDDAFWEEITETMDRFIALDQEDEEPIGEIFNAWEADPRVTTRAIPAAFTLDADGAHFGLDAPLSIWLSYRIRPSLFSGELWDSTTSYEEGAVVYSSTSGECYLATADSVNINPATDTNESAWVRQKLPAILAPFVKYAVTSDALDEDGQTDKARLKLSEAYDKLHEAMWKIAGQQGDVGRGFNVRTS